MMMSAIQRILVMAALVLCCVLVFNLDLLHGFDLRLMSSLNDVSAIPTQSRNFVIGPQ
jgi:hypothetical protein